MKKKVVVAFLLLVVVLVGWMMPQYVAVSNDEAGFAVRVRTSVHYKFPEPIIYWQK